MSNSFHDLSFQDCVRAMGKSWHSRCFGCEVCGLNFSTAHVGFHENEGRALCENCYANNVLPKCQGCQAPITDRTMKAMGGQWHVSCFVCKVPILSQLDETISGGAIAKNYQRVSLS